MKPTRTLRVAALLIALAGLAAGTTARGKPSTTVVGGVQQAYYAGTRATAADKVPTNAAEPTFAGPDLVLQTAFVGRDGAEPTIGVTRSGRPFFAAAQFDSTAAVLPRTWILTSVDGGVSWSSVQPGLAGDQTAPPLTGDPYVYVDPLTDRIFSIDLYVGCSYLMWSDSNGESWTTNPIACGVPVNDHQTLAAVPPGKTGLVTVGYPNILYYCVNQVFDSACGRSLDGGVSFQPAGGPAYLGVDPMSDEVVCSGLHGHVVGDSDGRVFLPSHSCGKTWIAISSDGAVTWKQVLVSDIATTGSDPSVAVDSAGNLYYTWHDAAQRLPYLSVSTDHGDTWSPPVMVAPPGVRETNFPTIDAGQPGQVAIMFPGSTAKDNTDPTRPWNTYVLTSLNALDPKPFFVSATANPLRDPIHRGNCVDRCAGMFDFLDVVVAPNQEIWAAATDTCTEERECNTPDGPRGNSARGLAIRMLSGPGLSGPMRFGPRPPVAAAPKPRPAAPPGRLPTTGFGPEFAWLALLGLAVALLGRRWRAAR